MINDVANLFLYGGFIGIAVFTLFYGLRSKWWKYLEGWAIMGRSTSMTLVSALVGAALFFGDYPGREFVRFVIFIFFFLTCWFSVFVVLRSQHDDSVRLKRLRAEYEEVMQREKAASK